MGFNTVMRQYEYWKEIVENIFHFRRCCVSFFYKLHLIRCRIFYLFPLLFQFQSENGIFNFIDWERRAKLKINMREIKWKSLFIICFPRKNILIFLELKIGKKGWRSHNFTPPQNICFLIKCQQFNRKIFPLFLFFFFLLSDLKGRNGQGNWRII